MNRLRSSSSSSSSSSYGIEPKHDVLSLCLEDILIAIKPSEADILRRRDIIIQLTSIVRSVQSLTGASVRPFGSFASNLYSKWGDLDISVELSQHPNTSTNVSRKRNLLRNIMRAIQKTGLGYSFQYIPLAKVPVVVLKSGQPPISCDISIDNYQGHIKSKFFLWLTEIDERFRDLVLLIKEWAKAKGINSPKSGTLNSFSLCLLIVCHLQTCEPAVLPPLREIYDGKLVSVSDSKSIYMVSEKSIEEKCVQAATTFKSRNRAPLSKLLVSFFEKFSEIGTWASEYVICTYEGRLESAMLRSQWATKTYELQVEDPFEQTENAARTVDALGLIAISLAFKDAHRKLSSYSVLSDRNELLKCLVKPEIAQKLGSSTQRHSYYTGGQSVGTGYYYSRPASSPSKVAAFPSTSRPSSSMTFARRF